MINLFNSLPTVEVSQRGEFSCCYVDPLYVDSDTENTIYGLNSHHYKFEATICNFGNFRDTGRVISFEDAKEIINNVLPNNTFLYNKKDVNQVLLQKQFENCGIPTKGFDFNISAERILEEISLIIDNDIQIRYPGKYLKETKLRENSNSYVTWKSEVE